MLSFLPKNLRDALQNVNLNQLYEIRLRADLPVSVNYGGVYCYLGVDGLTKRAENALKPTSEQIADTLYTAGKFSVYAVEEELKQGFLTTENGVRIGIAGKCVTEGGDTLAIASVSSLCIRIPHAVVGAGEQAYGLCFLDGLKNVLVCSPPGQGKTTVLRDLCRLLCKNTAKNVLLCDERGELAVGDLGGTVDVLSFAKKAYAFSVGIRALRPDVIVCDEVTIDDFPALAQAVKSGVFLLASAHLDDFSNVHERLKSVFERFLFLDKRVIGKIFALYDGAGQKIFIDEERRFG